MRKCSCNAINGRGINSFTDVTDELRQFIACCYILCLTVLQRVLSDKLPTLPVAVYQLTFLLMKLLSEHFVFPFLFGVGGRVGRWGGGSFRLVKHQSPGSRNRQTWCGFTVSGRKLSGIDFPVALLGDQQAVSREEQ